MTTIGVKLDTPQSASAMAAAGNGFAVGERYVADDGKEYVFVQANGAITGAGYVCTIDETYQAAMLSTSNDAGGDLIGIAGAAFADNDYGWVQIKGPCNIRVAASAAANVALNTTGTAGQIDDDGTAASYDILGLVLTTANGATAGNAAGVLNYPSIAQAANV